ncbi:MAG: cysteine desulfurase NifS [Parachlamydiales bacterium]|jgi:cysteine desulfurase
MKKIYLDNAATTPTLPEVVEAMNPFFFEKFGNPSSSCSYGREANSAIEEARGLIANFINAKKEEIYFTSGGTESNNFALKGVAFANKQKKHIITTATEHHAILEPCKFLESLGYEVTYLPVDKYGLVNLEDLENAITDQTFLISVMHANNEIGTIQPIYEIGKLAKERKILFHTDAVQSFGHLEIDVEKMNIDLLSASSHKLYGPKGVGLIYIRKGTKINSLLHGGDQENKKRASTQNTAGIVGFAKAVEIAKTEMAKEALKLTKLREMLIKGILSNIEDTTLNGHPVLRLPNNVNICFEFIEGESILLNLDMMGICSSTGSACNSSKLVSSHVLLAIGISPELAHSSIRFTLGKFTTKEDIEYLIQILPKVIKKLREMSPLYVKG